MNKAIVSAEYPQFAEALKALGYTVIPTELIPCDMPYERYHADMQCLIIDDTAFVLQGCAGLAGSLSDSYDVMLCGESFGGKYPDNVVLNAAVLGKRVICRVPSLDDKVKDYCMQNGFELLHVNQGYAKCSCAIVSDNAVITADKGIYDSLKEYKIDVLPIEQGRVELKGADCGFIGGASGYDKDNRTLYFCGDISRHPDGLRIKDFCKEHGTKIISLTEDGLTDIGGIIFC